MKLPRAALLAMVVKQFDQSQDWILVPADLRSKAEALCRDGMLEAGHGPLRFRPTPLGRLMAEELP